MTTIRPGGLLAAALAILVTGCADSAYMNEHYSGAYYPGENAAAGSNLAVFVFGSPFGQPPDQFSADVIDAMQGWDFAYPATRFVQPASAGPSTYRTVMVFDPGVFGPSICSSPLTRVETFSRIPVATPPVAAVPPSGSQAQAVGARIPLTAVLCRGDTYMAWIDGSVPSGNGPESAAFRHGIGQFTASLFPSRNPDYKQRGTGSNFRS